jgi:hypothetical protein
VARVSRALRDHRLDAGVAVAGHLRGVGGGEWEVLLGGRMAGIAGKRKVVGGITGKRKVV